VEAGGDLSAGMLRMIICSLSLDHGASGSLVCSLQLEKPFLK
jgi:hypothetical protein